MVNTSWLSRRLGKTVLTVWAVVTITFALTRLMPGSPVDQLRAQLLQKYGASSISEERLDQLVQFYINVRPDAPLWEQYVNYLISVMQGDLGQSIWYQRPVSGIISEALPWTVFVLTVSLILSFGIGVVLGAIMAYFEGSRFDVATTTLSTILNSTPFYLAALILLYVLAYQYDLFPTGGRTNARTTVGLNIPFLIGVLHHAALPIISMVITEFGGWALSMRGNSISVLGEEYIRVAKLRGISDLRIATRYVGRNAILPMYTGLMISIGFVMGGSVILEQVFSYAGVGYYMIQAVTSRDYPLMMGIFLIITLAVVVGVLLADLTYGLLDPRIGPGGETSEQF